MRVPRLISPPEGEVVGRPDLAPTNLLPLVAKTPHQPPPRLATGRMITAVILHKGKVLCVLCGVEIDVAPDQRPLVVIKSSGGEPNMRAITLAGTELHACQMGTAREKRAGRFPPKGS
jgi:hypothetical protein